MGKTSIWLHEDDIAFALSKGQSVSAGIRYCIAYVKSAEHIKKELKDILQCDNTVVPLVQSNINMSSNLKNKIFKNL